jgi:hypothetical protein
MTILPGVSFITMILLVVLIIACVTWIVSDVV